MFARIIRQFRSRKKKPKFASHFLRPATFNDLDFIMKEIVEGAKNNHFQPFILETKNQKLFREMFVNLIQGKVFKRSGEKGVEKLAGMLWIYESHTQSQIGYLFVAEKYQGSLDKEIEILMTGISKKFQKQGFGKHMIETFMQICPEYTTLFARCFPTSETMFQLFLKCGFKTINTKSDGTHELQFH